MSPAELTGMSNLIVEKLRVGRVNGVITPEMPMCGTELAEAFNKKFETKHTNVQVRDAVRFARRMKKPVASNGSGYWYATNPFELNGAISSLRNRAKDMLATLRELEVLQREMSDTEFEPSLTQPIKEAQHAQV
jgi:hypothetical protein